MAQNKKEIIMEKIPFICKAAEYELSPLGKEVVMNNPGLSRAELNKIIGKKLCELVISENEKEANELYKEAIPLLKADARGRHFLERKKWKKSAKTPPKPVAKMTVSTRADGVNVSVKTKPKAVAEQVPKSKPGWGAGERGGPKVNGWTAFQKQYRPLLKASQPDKTGREISSELGSCWRKMKLHFPGYVERYNSSVSSNPEDDELANAMKKIALVEKKHEKNLKKRRPEELRPPRHPPKTKVVRRTNEFSKLFLNPEAIDEEPATEPSTSDFVPEGWGAEAAAAKMADEDLGLDDMGVCDDEGGASSAMPTDPGWAAKNRAAVCVPYLETRVKKTPVERGPVPAALCSIEHHIKESMAYCKAAGVKVYEPCPGYTVAGKTGLYLTKTFYTTINQPSTSLQILKTEDALSPFPRYTVKVTTPDKVSTIVLSVGPTLPSAQWPTEARKPRLPRNHNAECRIWKTTVAPH